MHQVKTTLSHLRSVLYYAISYAIYEYDYIVAHNVNRRYDAILETRAEYQSKSRLGKWLARITDLTGCGWDTSPIDVDYSSDHYLMSSKIKPILPLVELCLGISESDDMDVYVDTDSAWIFDYYRAGRASVICGHMAPGPDFLERRHAKNSLLRRFYGLKPVDESA